MLSAIKKTDATFFSFGSSAMLLKLSTRRFPSSPYEEFGIVGELCPYSYYMQ
jgi:hypothetical protein